MRPYDAPAPTIARVTNPVKCQHCGGRMEKGELTEKSAGLQFVGVVLFILGICLLFLFPIGTLIGIAIMFSARRLGYKKTKVCRCESCGFYFERAD